MFNIANKISLWTAGISASGIKNLVGADSVSNSLPTPKDVSIFEQIFTGVSFWDSMLTLVSGIAQLFYTIIRFCLNIVDFLQYFVKHLIGIDYWEKGDVSLDTLGDSDIIFKFLYNSTVQRVFRYMLGLFVVLLILFAIIAIVKSEYAVALETEKAEVNALKVIKNCGKAILMVVLVPVLLVMGILASNAVLAGLVNTLNVNNHLSLGSQVFTSSAYDANRYRKYAENGIRYAISNDINVTIDGITVSIKSSVKPIIPKDYSKDDPFTGFAFKFKGSYYLYYVNSVDLNKIYSSGSRTYSGYDFYVKYFKEYLEVPLATYEYFNTERVAGKEYYIKSALNNKGINSAINQAAYNTWNYNSILNNNKTTFEKSLTYELYSKVYGESYTVDSGNTYADAKVYMNSDAWAAIHDGGKTGLVTLPDEYYVMADVVDFVVSDVAEVAYINALNPLIDWEYKNDASSTYLSSKFVKFNKNSSGTTITGIKSFVVNYKDSGMVVYTPKDQSRESLGAVYIMAYYSAAKNRYIPIVNGKFYTDDYGNSHKFTSDYLDSNYNGLIVARGILEQTAYKNVYGYPTEITAEYDKGLSGESVNTETEYYYTNSIEGKNLSTNTIIDLTASLNSNEFASNGKLKIYDAVDVSSEAGKKAIQDSLLKSFTYHTLVYDGLDESGNPKYISGSRSISDISWTYSGNSIKVNKNGQNKTVYVYSADKTIYARVDNSNMLTSGENVNQNYDLPLYAFVEIDSASGKVNVKYVYSLFKNADKTFFQNINSSKTIKEVSSPNNAYTADYNFSDGSGSVWSGSGVVAKSLNIRNSLTLGTASTEVSCYIDSSSVSYNSERSSYSKTTGRVLKINENITDTGYGDTVGCEVLKLYKDIDGSMINKNVNLAYANNAQSSNDSSTSTASGNFKEIDGTRVESGNLIIYQFGLYDNSGQMIQIPYKYKTGTGSNSKIVSKTTPIIVTLYYDTENHSVSIYANDLMTLKLSDEYSEEIVSISDDPYITSLYDMNKYAEETVSDSGVSSVIYKYRYKINNQYYYTDFKYGVSNGIISLTNVPTKLYRVSVKTYNLFTYYYNSTLQQYNPVTGSSSNIDKPLSESIAYVRPSSIKASQEAIRDGEYIYQVNVYLENNDDSATANGTLFGSLYTSIEYSTDEDGSIIVPSPNLNQLFGNSYRFIIGINDFQKVPVYTNTDIETELKASSATIYFKRQYVSGGQIYVDFDIKFFNGKTNRFRMSLFHGTSDTKTNTSSFRIVGSKFKFDYNFVSSTALGLDLKIFYLPTHLNFVILIIATGLLISILGKAVWGLIQRIFDITLYFIILPGITSTYPLDDGKKFGKWKETVVQKVLGAYGVMLGLNIFFILCPAIKSISHLFTPEDLNQLSSGNVLSGVSAGFINSVCELLFMLVALTMIQSLPGLISGLVGGEDAVKTGESTKKNVGSAVKEAGGVITGANALDTVLGKYDDKAGKRKGGVVGQLKNFVPGSAVYDDVSKKIKAKKEAAKKAAAEEAEKNAKKAAANAAAEAANKAAEYANRANNMKVEDNKDSTANNNGTPNNETQNNGTPNNPATPPVIPEDKGNDADVDNETPKDTQIDGNNDNNADKGNDADGNNGTPKVENNGEDNNADKGNDADGNNETPKETPKGNNGEDKKDPKSNEEGDKDNKDAKPNGETPKGNNGENNSDKGAQPSGGKEDKEKKEEDKKPTDPAVIEKMAELQNKIAEMDQILSKINISKLKQEINDLKQKRDEAQNSNKFVELYEKLRQTLINKSGEFRGKDTEAQNAELDRIIAEGKYGNSSKGYANKILREIGQLGMTFDNSNNKASKVYSDLSKKKADSSALISDIDKQIVDKQKQIAAGGDAELAKLQTNVEQRQSEYDEITSKITKNEQQLAAIDAFDKLKADKGIFKLDQDVDKFVKEYTKDPDKFKKERKGIYSKYGSEIELLSKFAKENKLNISQTGSHAIANAIKGIDGDTVLADTIELNREKIEKEKELSEAQGKRDEYVKEKEAYRSEIATKAENLDQNSMNKIIEEMKAQLDDAQGKIDKLLLDAAAAKIKEVEKDLNSMKIIEEMKAQLDDARGKINKLLIDAADAKIREVERDEKNLNESSQTNINLERARLYAEAAQKAQEAAKIYSDIASGNVGQYAPETGNKRKSSLEKDYEKLSELLNERSKRLEDQENGQADLSNKMDPISRKKAYDEYNKTHDKKDAIIDKLDISEEEKEKLKKQKALDLYNQNHGTQLTELDAKQQKEADKLLKVDQDALKAVARKEYTDRKLDQDISKLQEKIALKENGLYVNPLMKLIKSGGSLLAKGGSLLLGNRDTEATRQKYEKMIAKSEQKGKALTEQLEHLDDEIAKEKADLIRGKGLVIGKDGKIDRTATTKKGMNNLDQKDDEAIRIRKDERKAEFDDLDSRLEAINNGTYKQQREKQIQAQLDRERNKFDRLTEQLNNRKFGWANTFAARLSSGKRAVKAHFEKKGIERAESMLQTETENFEQKATLSERKAHGGQKYTDKQAKTLDGLKSSRDSYRVELEKRMKDAGFKGDNIDFESIDKFSKELKQKISAETDSSKKAKLEKLSKDFEKSAASYISAKEKYDSRRVEFSRENKESYLGNADLRQRRVKVVELRKAKLAKQLAEAKRSGRLSEAEETQYIQDLANYESQIKDINSSYQQYRKPRKKVKTQKFNYKQLARKRLATSEAVDSRKQQIVDRDDSAQTRITEKVSVMKAKQAETATRITEKSQREYAEKVIKALSKSGNADLIKQITSATTPAAAAAAAKQASLQAMQALEAKKKEIQKELRSNTSKAREEDLKAQEKVVSSTLKKLKAETNSDKVSSKQAKSSELKAQSEAAVSAAIRSAYKEQWNKFAASNGMRTRARSGSTAYEANKELRSRLSAENAKLQKQIDDLKRKTASSAEISKLTALIDLNGSKLKQLESMNRDAENKAKKALKKTTSIERIMKDMRTASKYKIPGINKPTGSN